jgi:hypothetical protein
MSTEKTLTGKVIKVLDQETGTGAKGVWVKQSFVIETNDQYPKKVCIQAWGDKCDLIPPVGQEVKVSFDVESREYNNKWYTDVKVGKIESATKVAESKPETKASGKSSSTTSEDDDLPF